MGVVWCWIMLLVPCNNRYGFGHVGCQLISSREHSAVLVWYRFGRLPNYSLSMQI